MLAKNCITNELSLKRFLNAKLKFIFDIDSRNLLSFINCQYIHHLRFELENEDLEEICKFHLKKHTISKDQKNINQISKACVSIHQICKKYIESHVFTPSFLINFMTGYFTTLSQEIETSNKMLFSNRKLYSLVENLMKETVGKNKGDSIFDDFEEEQEEDERIKIENEQVSLFIKNL